MAMTKAGVADAELVRSAKAGHYGAFEQLFLRHHHAVHRLAFRILAKPEDAEEVVQQTFLAAFEKLQDFRNDAKFFTWLARITTNKSLNLLRKQARCDVLTDDGNLDDETWLDLPCPTSTRTWLADPERSAQAQELKSLLIELIEDLAPPYRVLFVLRDMEGFTTAQAAEMLGISVSNAKVRLMRARLQLRAQLEERMGSPTDVPKR